jgi:23S rRNA (cytidine1920-2'-O)/16S rRNA (cytidine1409-2'-O)-methyltransferase
VPRSRLDKLVVEHGLAPTTEKAQALILAGQIAVEGERADKAGAQFPKDAQIELVGHPSRYASRGGLKLEGALADFQLDPTGKICLDIGASHGGFTDCLLQHGAVRVYAVDVGKGQLEWKLRQDERVVVCEGINARDLQPDDIGEPVDWVTADVAFISLTKILPAAVACAKDGALFLLLVKPQFELSREKVGKGGIVHDSESHDEAVETVRRAALALGLEETSVYPSRTPGAEGNREFFLACRKTSQIPKSS